MTKDCGFDLKRNGIVSNLYDFVTYILPKHKTSHNSQMDTYNSV